MEWLSSRMDEDTIVYEEDVLKSTLIYSSLASLGNQPCHWQHFERVGEKNGN